MITSVSPTNRPQQEGTVVRVVSAIEILLRLSAQSRKCYDPQGDYRCVRLATLLIALSVCLVAWASDCPPTSGPDKPVHSDEPLDLSIFFDNTLAVATPFQLYAGDKLMHTEIPDQNGNVRLGLMPDGKYRVVIPRKGTLDVVVLQQKSGHNGPYFRWFLFPKSKYKWVAGKKVAGKPCPTWGLEEKTNGSDGIGPSEVEMSVYDRQNKVIPQFLQSRLSETSVISLQTNPFPKHPLICAAPPP